MLLRQFYWMRFLVLYVGCCMVCGLLYGQCPFVWYVGCCKLCGNLNNS